MVSQSERKIIEDGLMERIKSQTSHRNYDFTDQEIRDKIFPDYFAKGVHLIDCIVGKYMFFRSEGITFDNCQIKGSNIFGEAKGVTIRGSKSGDGTRVLEEAEDVIIQNSEFHNPALLNEGKSISIYGSEFYGLNSLSKTEKVNMHSGKFHAEGAFIGANNVRVLSGEFLGPLAFHYARDVIVYSPDTVIRHLSAARNSIIIVGSIDEVVNYNPKAGTAIYCISPGKKAAPYVTTIKREAFEKVNDISELAEKAARLHQKMTS
jgi:hypothetical protein